MISVGAEAERVAVRTDPELEALLQDLYARERSGMNLDLEVTRRVLAGLGSPERQLRAIHIAGTNGKGSVSAMVATALQEAGYKVGLYTSPHLVHFGERVRVQGVPLTGAETVALFREVDEAAAREGVRVTFFEATTAMAFLKFARERVDVAVLEVGLGGRLDATNVCHPLACAVVTIDFDHMQYLGDTLGKIATEKAGIAKPGVPMVCGAVEHEARVAIGQRCAAVGAPLSVLGEDFFASAAPDNISYRGPSWHLDGLTLGLRGPYQRHNAAVALRLLEVVSQRGLALRADDARRGLAAARWPGRLELLPGDPAVFLDGAHNPHGARALCEALDERFLGRPIHLIFGASGDKDVHQMLGILLRRASSLYACHSARKGALAPERIVEAAQALRPGLPAVAAGEVEQALSLARAHAAPGDLLVVAGSLFVVGEARAALLGDGA